MKTYYKISWGRMLHINKQGFLSEFTTDHTGDKYLGTAKSWRPIFIDEETGTVRQSVDPFCVFNFQVGYSHWEFAEGIQDYQEYSFDELKENLAKEYNYWRRRSDEKRHILNQELSILVESYESVLNYYADGAKVIGFDDGTKARQVLGKSRI